MEIASTNPNYINHHKQTDNRDINYQNFFSDYIRNIYYPNS